MARPGFPIFGKALLAQWFQPKMASVASYTGRPNLRAFEATPTNTNPAL